MRTVSSPVIEAEARRHRQQPIAGNRSSELSCRRRDPSLSLPLCPSFLLCSSPLPSVSSFFLSPSFGLNNCDGPRVDINLRPIICLFPSALYLFSFFSPFQIKFPFSRVAFYSPATSTPLIGSQLFDSTRLSRSSSLESFIFTAFKERKGELRR